MFFPRLALCGWLLAVITVATHIKAQSPAGGELDAGFGSNGQTIATLAGFTTQAFGCDRQSDGKLIVVGQAWGGGTTFRMVVARFNTDGSLDTDFGSGGFALYGPSAGQTYAARSVKVLSDGKILVAGDASGSVMTVRFLDTGAVDGTFSVISSFLGTNAQATGLAVQADGKALVSAIALRSGSSDNDAYVLRFNASGSIDTFFGSSGRFTYGGASEQTAMGIVVLPDGKSLHVGTANNTDMYVARLTTSGTLDTSFRSSGRGLVSAVSGSTPEGARAVALDADGNILIAGQSNPGAANDVLVARLTSTGFLDTTFSSDGWLLTNFGGSSGVPTGIAAQADGRILVAGHRPSGAGTGFALRRIHWNGDADTSFDGDGLAAVAVGVSTADTAGLLIQADRKIVVAGSALASGGGSLRGVGLVRYEPGPALEGPVIEITEQPQAVTVLVGMPASFSVTAESEVPLTYGWYRNNSLLVRGPSSTYSINNAFLSHEGLYKVEVRSGPYVVWSSEVNLKVLSPPVITEPVQPRFRGLKGSSATFYVSVSGRQPMACKWFKGDDQIAQTTVSSVASLYFPALTAADAGFYHFQLSNADGHALSQTYEVVVVGDPSVDVLGEGYILDLGQPYQLEAEVNASADYRLQWSKNGKAIAKAVDSHYPIEAASFADAGAYTLTVRSLKGADTSEPDHLAVFDRADRNHIAATNKKYVMSARIAGAGLEFQWYKGDQQLANGGRISGADSANLSFKTVEAGDAGDYTCEVSGYGMTKISGIQHLQVATEAPALAGFVLPEAHVGLIYYHEPELSDMATHFEFTGLPAGFNYSKAENRLSGTPTKPGTYMVKAVAINLIGSSAPMTVALVVNELPEGIAGRYFAPASDGVVQGFMDLTVAQSGVYSGKVHLSDLQGKATTAAFAGVLSFDNGPAGENPPPTSFYSETAIRVAGVFPNITGPGSVIISFAGSYCEGGIRVPYRLPQGGGDTEAYISFYLPLCPWNASQPLPESYRGSFNLALASSGEPSGYGLAKAKVSAAGIASIAGKLPDGTGVTVSAPAAFDYTVSGTSFLYGHRGIIMGTWYLNPGSSGPDYLDASITGDLYWTKSAIPASLGSYPAGFSNGLSIQGGSKYLAPNIPVLTGPLVMNAAEGPGNVYLEVMGYGITGTLGRNHAVRLPKTLEENPLSITSLVFNAGTGTFTASSSYSYKEIWYDEKDKPHVVTLTKPFKMQGIVVREPTQITSYAVGFALVPTAYDFNRFTKIAVPVSISAAY